MLQPENFDNKPKVVKNKLNILPPNPEVSCSEKAVKLGRFPSWLHRKLPTGDNLWETGKILDDNQLHTVCEEAKCPNLPECWSKKTATFLAMGKECTRACGFCDIDFTKKPKALEEDEPRRIAYSAKKLGLKHIVITMVARDDLPDQGANHIARIIHEVRAQVAGCTIEVLTSDFNGDRESQEIVLSAFPEIFNHNLETVRELTPRVRHKATYEQTLKVLQHAKNFSREKKSGLLVKSGIMLGLGESEDQVKETLLNLRDVGCDIVTMGQYLQANNHKLRVKEFVHPDQFKAYEEFGYKIGIEYMYCGPFVRSSYNANTIIKEFEKK